MLKHPFITMAASLAFTANSVASTVHVTVINLSADAVALRPTSNNDRNTMAYAEPFVAANPFTYDWAAESVIR